MQISGFQKLESQCIVNHQNRQVCRQAAGDARLLNPNQTVDLSPGARRNDKGEVLLPSNIVWRPHLLLMAVASRLLALADDLLKIQPAARSIQQQQAMALLRGQRIPPVPYLVSQMVQPHKVWMQSPPSPQTSQQSITVQPLIAWSIIWGVMPPAPNVCSQCQRPLLPCSLKNMVPLPLHIQLQDCLTVVCFTLGGKALHGIWEIHQPLNQILLALHHPTTHSESCMLKLPKE